MRGEYAAVTAWFGVALMIGGMGQPAALCFHVAHDPGNARSYVATSRAMMLVTGTAALAGGILLAPLLARGNAGLTVAYRIAFATSIVAFVGASYTFSLQARNLRWWNEVRVSQPVLSLAFLVVLWRLRLLTLTAALIVLALTMLLQLGWAYYRCRSADLAPGHAQARLVRPLARYGVAQIAALTPAALNANLDQLVLSQAVPPAVLGRYAIAVSCSLLPIPLVSAIGNVAFPRLASRQRVDGLAGRMQWLGILGSACAAAGALVPLDLVAPWLVPRVFGPGYAGVVPLLWILTPAGVFLACNQVTGDVLRGRKRPLVVARARGACGRIHGDPAGGPPACRWCLRRGDSVRGGLRCRARHDAPVLAKTAARQSRSPRTAGARLMKTHLRERKDARKRRDDCRPPGRGDRHGPHLPGSGEAHRRPDRPLRPFARAP